MATFRDHAASPAPNHFGSGTLEFLALSCWCGLAAGLLEVAILVARKRLFDINQFFWMSRHFVWLIPATNVAVFAVIASAVAPLSFWSRSAHAYVSRRLLCALFLLPIFWVGFPAIFGPAGLLLSLGIATRLVPIIEANPEVFRRLVKVSTPIFVAIFVALMAIELARDPYRVWTARSRPVPPAGSPSVLLIVLDTVGAEHLGLYGYGRPTSPTIDSLARRGIQFNRARATASWTLPSHAGLFTGRWPHELSCGWLTPLDSKHPTLAELLSARGYDTVGIVANTFYCGTDSGLNRGFARYDDYVFPELSAFKLASIVGRPLEGLRAIDNALRARIYSVFFQDLIRKFDAGNRKPASVVNRQFLAWLSDRPEPRRPFFAFLNFFDAHYPYRPEPGGMRRFGSRARTDREIDLIENWRTIDKSRLSAREISFVRDAYDDCIADLDERLGRLIDQLERSGVLETTWVIITADHGESLGERPGVFGHGVSLHSTELHVPLIVLPPGGHSTPTVVDRVVSLRDLPATILELLGLEPSARIPGRSLARFWTGVGQDDDSGTTDEPAPAISEVVPTDPLDSDPRRALARRRALAALADDEWTLIETEGEEQAQLYHARQDPQEAIDRASEPGLRPVISHLRETLDRLMAGPLVARRLNP